MAYILSGGLYGRHYGMPLIMLLFVVDSCYLHVYVILVHEK